MFPQLKKLFMLDPNITYLNHGSFGACPKPIFEDLIHHQKKLEYEPVKYLDMNILDLLNKSRNHLSNYINCNINDIALFQNPSTALNTVIKSLNLQKGDEILSTNHEYGALNMAWRDICKKTGAKYIQKDIQLPLTSKDQFINEFSKSISKKTKVIFLSHITSPTALIFPVKEICKIAKENNIISIIDGAHVPGHIKLDIKDIKPDVYTGACHKWMCSPKGTCFLYVKEELQSIIEPLVISWGYEAEVSSGSQFLDYLQWQGTKDISAYLTLPYTIKFLKKNNWNEVSKKCHNLTIWAKDEINNLLNQPSLADNDFLGQMSSFYINSKNPKRDQLDFYNKYNIQIPFIKWNNQVLMRISIQAYNSKEDVNKLLEALKNEYC